MSDLDTSPISVFQTDQQLAESLLDQLLDKSHPLLVDALYLAAIVFRYDAALLGALRAENDDRDARIAERLAKISFVQRVGQVERGGEELTQYQVLATERQILLRRMIQNQPEKYRLAHERALKFGEANPNPDSSVAQQERLAHLLVVDGPAAIRYLSDTFRDYLNDRQLAAAERLLEVPSAMREQLTLLGVPWLALLADWQVYLVARLQQFQNRFDECREQLRQLHEREDLDSQLRPFVMRAYATTLVQENNYVDAIELYRHALEGFEGQPNAEAEQGFTMLNMGDAYLELALSARGVRDLLPPNRTEQSRLIWDILLLPLNLPLLVMMLVYFGSRMLNPASWSMLRGQDWIIVRLFGETERWYRRADKLLRAAFPPNHPDRLQASEKQANLYLVMGDADAAAPTLRRLLADSGGFLGEYRKARVKVNLARALYRLGEYQQAEQLLTEALPVAEQFEDLALQAQTRGLLAETLFAQNKVEDAVQAMDQSMRAFIELRDVVGVTEISQRLAQLEDENRLTVSQTMTATTSAKNLGRRQFLVRYVHPAAALFQRLSLVVLSGFLVLTLLLTVRVENLSAVSPGIGFEASAPLRVDTGLGALLTLDVSPSFRTTLSSQVDSDVLLFRALAALVAYAVVYTLVGVFIILSTRLRTVQRAQKQAIHINFRALAQGATQESNAIDWLDVTHVVQADVRLLGRLLTERSGFAVASPEKQITITGQTSWYSSVWSRVHEFTKRAQTQTNLSYNMFGGRLGWMFLIGLVLVMGFVFAGQVFAQALSQPIPGTPYTLVSLFPYYFLLLVIPLVWWLVVQPLRIEAYLAPKSRLLWLYLAAGLALFVVRMATFRLNWLPTPDIYLWVVTGVLVGYPAWLAYRLHMPRAQDLKASQPAEAAKAVYPNWLRTAAMGVGALVVVMSLVAGGLQVAGYHFQMQGDQWRREAGALEADVDDTEVKALLERSAEQYELSLQVVPGNPSALNNRGVVFTQLGRYGEAIEDFSRAIGIWPGRALFYSNRAVAYEGLALDALQAGADSTSEQVAINFNAAINDFDRAIALQPNDAQYYFWRGTAYQVRGDLKTALADYDQSLTLRPNNAEVITAIAWVYFQQAEATQGNTPEEQIALAAERYEKALAQFQLLVDDGQATAETYLGIGYIKYQQGQAQSSAADRAPFYQEALAAWEQAVDLDPQNPSALVSRATGYWAASTTPTFYCRVATATDEERLTAIAALENGIEDVNTALTLAPGDAFTYRTKAQLEYLLSFCDPEYEVAPQLQAAITSYGEALRLAPEEDLYWLFRARLSAPLALEQFKIDDTQGALLTLERAGADAAQALNLDPANSDNQLWNEFFTNWDEGYLYLRRGDYYEGLGDYEVAYADFQSAIDLYSADVPEEGPARALAGDLTEAYLSTGRMALQLGDIREGREWSLLGADRAEALGNGFQMSLSINKLNGLLTADSTMGGDTAREVLAYLYVKRGYIRLNTAALEAARDDMLAATTAAAEDLAISSEAYCGAGLTWLALGDETQMRSAYSQCISQAVRYGHGAVLADAATRLQAYASANGLTDNAAVAEVLVDLTEASGSAAVVVDNAGGVMRATIIKG